MTKTLTEQFLYGQLLDGYWYINIDGSEDILEVERGKYYIGGALVARAFMGDKIDKIEVLAPVPSYNEVKEMSQKIERLEFDNDALEISRDVLEKKLDIAVKALDSLRGICFPQRAEEALEEIEEVK